MFESTGIRTLFSVEPASQEDVNQKELPTHEVMDLIFSYQDERKLTKNLELSYNNKVYQIKTNTKGYRLQHATVTICEDLSGLITIVSQGKILDYTCHIRAKHNPEIIDSKQLGHKLDLKRSPAKTF